jgi:hypothetical protein
MRLTDTSRDASSRVTDRPCSVLMRLTLSSSDSLRVEPDQLTCLRFSHLLWRAFIPRRTARCSADSRTSLVSSTGSKRESVLDRLLCLSRGSRSMPGGVGSLLNICRAPSRSCGSLPAWAVWSDRRCGRIGLTASAVGSTADLVIGCRLGTRLRYPPTLRRFHQATALAA